MKCAMSKLEDWALWTYLGSRKIIMNMHIRNKPTLKTCNYHVIRNIKKYFLFLSSVRMILERDFFLVTATNYFDVPGRPMNHKSACRVSRITDVKTGLDYRVSNCSQISYINADSDWQTFANEGLVCIIF